MDCLTILSAIVPRMRSYTGRTEKTTWRFSLSVGGFTAGIVCFLYVPILEHYFKSKQQRRGQA